MLISDYLENGGIDMAQAARGERVHIGVFGRRNAGKSSRLNALTGQRAALVTEVAGTTTDPVKKTMELLPLGPVVIIYTTGIDDEGGLGGKRVAQARKILGKTDIAVFVVSNIHRTERRVPSQSYAVKAERLYMPRHATQERRSPSR